MITPDYLPQIQRQRQDVLLQIEIGTQTGRTHWVEANQRKLALIEPVIDVLTEGKVQGEIGANLIRMHTSGGGPQWTLPRRERHE